MFDNIISSIVTFQFSPHW